MAANPALGVFLHGVGGFAAGSFYLPLKRVRKWSWESYWLVNGVYSWIIAPWIFAAVVCSANGVSLPAILREGFTRHGAAMAWAYCFGAMWGVGGLTFGLTMRYLGMSLGMAVALGFCAAFGTVIPPIYSGTFADLLGSTSGLVTLAGVVVCLLGITLCGRAGMVKEREMTDDAKRVTIAEFNFVKGMWVAVFAGIMSACMAFGISAGAPLGEIAGRMGVPDVLKNTPVLIVVLAGGFTTNVIWCVALNARNGTFGDYFSGRGASVALNYLFSALAGVTWYLQFFFYSMGQTKMGKEYEFSSWTLHMATIILFSNLWGIALQEWRGTSRRVHRLIFGGLTVLVVSTGVVGAGSYLAPLITRSPAAQAVRTGDVAVFTVEVAERKPRYQWRKDEYDLTGTDRISGANTATLRIDRVGPADAGEYQCVIHGRFGKAESAGAALTVKPPDD